MIFVFPKVLRIMACFMIASEKLSGSALDAIDRCKAMTSWQHNSIKPRRFKLLSWLTGCYKGEITLYIPSDKKLCITKIWISLEQMAIPTWFFWRFFHTSLNDFASISCQFQKTITVTAHSFWFKILCYHTHIAPWSDSFCFERVSLHSETTEKHVFFLDWHCLSPAPTYRVCQVTTVFRTMGC